MIIYFEFVEVTAQGVSDVCEKLCTYNRAIEDIFARKSLQKPILLMKGNIVHIYKKISTTNYNYMGNRAVYIPLMLAERAWSYAMQLRIEANTEPRKKFHLVSRLRKAASYALQLQKLCEVLIYHYVL